MVGPLVEVWLPYGTSEIPARIPAERLVDILKPEDQLEIQDYLTEAKSALESNEPLARSASGSKSTCIALGSCGGQQLAVALARMVVEFLASKFNGPIVILRSQDAPELDPSALGQTTVVKHNPVSSPTTPLTAFNGPFSLELNSEFVNADLRIVIGELKPSALLKFAGLTDVILPGLASAATVTSHLSNRAGLVMDDLYKERVQAGMSIENLFLLGLAIPDGTHPAQLACDTLKECLQSLEKTVEETFARNFSKKAEIVVMGAGGTPADRSLASAIETLPVGLSALKKNGALIVAAECESGHGNGEFYEWCAEGKEARYLEARLRRRLNYDGFKAALLRRTLDTHKVYLVSTIPDHYVEGVFKMRAARTISAALLSAQRVQGSDATISVIPNGSRVIPKLVEPQKQEPIQ
jgi:hypothetical protein